MKEIFKKILDVLMLLIIFVDFSYNIYIQNFVNLRLTYVFYLVYFIVYIKYFINITFIKYFVTNFKYLLIVLFFIIVTSIYNIYVDNNTFFLFIKQLVIVCFTSFVCFMFVYNNKNNLDYIIKLYIQISLIVCCIAIVQEICWFIGFKSGYDLSYLIINNQQISTSGIMLRVTSICGEPPVLAYALIFAINIAIFRMLTGDCTFLKHKIQAVILFMGMILTYSTIGYMSMILSFCFILFWNLKKINLKSCFLLISVVIIFFCIGKTGITGRIYQTLSSVKISSVEKNLDINRTVNLNRSSYDLAVHFLRAYYDFQENPFIGKGLGSYNYSKNAQKLESFSYMKEIDFSKEDTISFVLKVISELGLFGVIVLIIFILFNFIYDFGRKNIKNKYILFNCAALVYILFRLIRSPTYYTEGMFIFFWLYYFSKQKFLEERAKENITKYS